MKLHAERQPFNGAISLYAGDQRGQQWLEAQAIVFSVVAEGTIGVPFMRLAQEEAQRLMDELWNCGVRPSEGAGSAGALAATERHLEDMRSLVFGVQRMTNESNQP
jgi:hypothetical protein